MATEFLLPDIGEGLVEATIVRWFVKIGDFVEVDGPLVEVETDKAVVEIPSPVGGVVLHIGAKEGEVLAVERLLAVIGGQGESWTPSRAGLNEAIRAGDVAPIVGTLESSSQPPAGDGVQALPMVRRLAAELGIDITDLSGTGPGGRVTEDDVREAGESTWGPHRRVELTPTRKAIIRNLTRSWQEIPHVTTYGEVDAGALLADRVGRGKPPLEAIVIARLVPVLRAFPSFNATLHGDAVIEHERYDIGIAVDAPDGLMVVVLRDADTKSIDELGNEIQLLRDAARDRSVKREQLMGQTFTLSNIGAVGGRYGTPIIPYGTTAILSLGRAEPRPVVRDAEVVIATELPLSLSYDHRVVDGGTGRAFLAAVVNALA